MEKKDSSYTIESIDQLVLVAMAKIFIWIIEICVKLLYEYVWIIEQLVQSLQQITPQRLDTVLNRLE